MATYRELTGAGVSTRAAAALVGVPRASATRRPRPPVVSAVRVPRNKLSDAERSRILATVNSDRFVDLPPVQIYAHLLDEGVYLGSISTIYRVLAANAQSKSAAAWPATPPGRSLSWSRPGRGRCTPGTSPSSPGRSRAPTSTPT